MCYKYVRWRYGDDGDCVHNLEHQRAQLWKKLRTKHTWTWSCSSACQFYRNSIYHISFKSTRQNEIISFLWVFRVSCVELKVLWINVSRELQRRSEVVTGDNTGGKIDGNVCVSTGRKNQIAGTSNVYTEYISYYAILMHTHFVYSWSDSLGHRALSKLHCDSIHRKIADDGGWNPESGNLKSATYRTS